MGSGGRSTSADTERYADQCEVTRPGVGSGTVAPFGTAELHGSTNGPDVRHAATEPWTVAAPARGPAT
ncbi:hypothetical protein Acsp06_11350 [Actinomycetospora sp. NBRC 106375]|nr:hypothetical protein Acsp06_11350 [Actinomycetospora sp. NBRC 106375]